MMARIGLLRALNRNVQREFVTSRKDTHWGRQKPKRDLTAEDFISLKRPIDCRDLLLCSAMKGRMACAPGDRKIQAMEEPKCLLKVALYKEGTSPMEICAAMRHAGEIWLVPDWIRSPRGRSAKPLRMIPLSKFPYKKFPRTSEAFADYAIDGVVPKGLFDRRIPPVLSAAFGVLERPAVRVQMGLLHCP